MALASLSVLVVAPNVIGLLARLSIAMLRRFWAWWPPERLQPLPLSVAALVMVVTAYALATRGSRMRGPGPSKRRRFLPPLDLLLLQLGNVTFLAFALVLAVATAGLLSSALQALLGEPRLLAHSLALSLAAAIAAALLPLRGPWLPESWRTLRQRWLEHAAILGGAVGGFWLIGWGPERSPLKIRWMDSQLDLATLASLWGLLGILLACGAGLSRFERSDAPESIPRRRWLGVTSLLAWVAYIGFLTLYLNGAFLTLRGHLAAS